MSKKPYKQNGKSSRKQFSRTAKKVHAKNGGTTMRGGIRL